MDKDNDLPTDGHVGSFETTVNPGAKELEIQGPIFQRSRGSFFLKVFID